VEKTKMKFSKEKGIQAIIELQGLVGITESKEKAERSWNKFSSGEKEQTMLAHSICCKIKKLNKLTLKIKKGTTNDSKLH
jgi:hypothetical protein